MRTVAATLILACALSACSIFGIHAEDVTAHTTRDLQLQISNHTSERIYYMIVGREAAALINWPQHLSAEASVAPGQRKSVSYEAFLNVQEEEEAIVYWWHAEEKDGQPVPGKVHAIIVDLLRPGSSITSIVRKHFDGPETNPG